MTHQHLGLQSPRLQATHSQRPCQIQHTMTVGELIAALEQFDEDTQVFLKHDGGYTYGGISWGDLEEDE